MTKQEKIQELIVARNNGDKTAQAKIDILFNEHREETSSTRESESATLSAIQSAAFASLG